MLHDFFIEVSYARAIMKRTTLLLATALTLTTAVTLRAQSQQQYKNEVSIEVLDGFRYITANGIPDHVTGPFPNRGQPPLHLAAALRLSRPRQARAR